MKSRFLSIALATVMFVSIHPIAQAGVVDIEGYSCDNSKNLEVDIIELTNELPRLRRNSFVQGQVNMEIHRLKAEKEMLRIICKPEDEGPLIVIVHELSKEY